MADAAGGARRRSCFSLSLPLPVLLLAPLLSLATLSLACAGCGSLVPTGELRSEVREGGGGGGEGDLGNGAGSSAGSGAGSSAGSDGKEEPAEPVLRPEPYRFEDLVPFDGGLVTVLALPGATGPDPRAFAAELSAAVEAMASRVPLDPERLRRDPLTVAVEATYPQQILHAGEVGEAVLGGPAEVHLVFHPDDGFAYHHALARALLRRAGSRTGGASGGDAGGGGGPNAGSDPAPPRPPADADSDPAPEPSRASEPTASPAPVAAPVPASDLPPYLRLGAAWWLVDPGGGSRWYGRTRAGWLPRLAAAGVLPTIDELLAAEEPPDGSRLLWTPVAAAVVDALPGATLAEKLAAADGEELRVHGERFLAELAGSVAPSFAPPAGRAAGRHENAPQPSPRSAGQGRQPPGATGGNPGRAPGPGTGGDTAPGLDPALRGPGPAPASPGQPAPLPPFLAGVSLAMLNHVQLGYHAPSVDAALANLRRAVAANAVSLMPFAYQRRPDDPRLVYLNRRPRSETDAAMLHAGRRADARGFTVLWKPQIWLPGSWPGEVAMDSEAEWGTWFRTYRRFLVHQAVLADRVGAEIFSVGVELGRTVERTADWRRVIDAVQLFYAGPLTYSANWYGDFDRVTFWGRLDYLGLDAYEPLTDDPGASDAALAAGARRIVDGMATAAAEHGKPLVLTEVGYAAHQAAWVAPHEEGGPLSPDDQARAYRAFLGALQTADGPPPWLAGLFLWKSFSSGPRGPDGQEIGERGEDFADFRFLGRPAEDVIHRHFERFLEAEVP